MGVGFSYTSSDINASCETIRFVTYQIEWYSVKLSKIPYKLMSIIDFDAYK